MLKKIPDKIAAISSIIMAMLFFVLGPAILVYIVDPFQIYHKPIFKNQKYSKEQAWQHAGWIKQVLTDPSRNYEAIILGSSTMANYTQTMVNEYLPWGNTMNLSINGGTPHMQHAIARYTLEKKPDIKHILWDIHFYYAASPDDLKIDPAEKRFPDYLYNGSLLDDRPYLFNQTNIAHSLDFLIGDFAAFRYGIEDNGPFYENLVAEGRFDYYGSDENIKNNLAPKIADMQRSKPSAELYENLQLLSIDTYLLDLLMPFCNSDKDIVILFSPATRLQLASINIPEYLDRLILMRRYIVDRTSRCNNIHVYAFDNVDWIVTNLRNYADNFHHNLEVNRYILQSIASHKHQLTMDNIDQYESQLILGINGYRNFLISTLEAP